MKYLTVEQVIDVNKRLISLTSPTEMIGVKDMGMLESAVNRPKQSILEKMPMQQFLKKRQYYLNLWLKTIHFKMQTKELHLLV